jgi:hypothetical protein
LLLEFLDPLLDALDFPTLAVAICVDVVGEGLNPGGVSEEWEAGLRLVRLGRGGRMNL